MKINKTTIFASTIFILYLCFVYLGLTGKFVMSKSIDILGLNIHLYALFILFGIGAAFATFNQIVSSVKSLRNADYYDMLFYSVILGIFGARIWHVITDWHLYDSNLIKAFYVWNGGLGIFGALIFGAGGVYYFAKQNKLDFMRLVNAISITLPLAQAIGRVGNFVNQELYGPVTDVLWKWYIPATGQYHHPAFLYEQILNLILFFILFWRYKKNGLDNKFLPIYLFGYSLIRFIVEFYRLSPRVMWGMSVAQVVSVILLAYIMYLYIKDYGRKCSK